MKYAVVFLLIFIILFTLFIGIIGESPDSSTPIHDASCNLHPSLLQSGESFKSPSQTLEKMSLPALRSGNYVENLANSFPLSSCPRGWGNPITGKNTTENTCEFPDITTDFNPNNVPGCFLWLDGNDKTSLVISEESKVKTWNDKSSSKLSFNSYNQTDTSCFPSISQMSNNKNNY